MENIRYEKVDIKSKEDIKDLYVVINDNGIKRHIAIKDLAIARDKAVLSIESLKDLKKADYENCLFTKKSNGVIDKQVVIADDDFYKRLDSTSIIEGGKGYFVSTTIQGDRFIPVGYQRAVRVKRDKETDENIIITKNPSDLLKEREYLLAKFIDGTERFLSRDEIVVGSATAKVLGGSKLSVLNSAKSLKDLNGNSIIEIDTKKAYTFENQLVEEDNVEIAVRESFEGNVHTVLKETEDGIVTTEDEVIENIYTEQNYLMEGETPIVRVSNYEANKSNAGDFVKVTFAGESTETMIKKNELFKNSALTEPVTVFSEDLIGKVLYAKSDDENSHYKITKPITSVQANFTYSKKQYLQETEKKEHIGAPGTYVKLETGYYIKEESLEPICWDYTKSSENPEAYLAKVVDSKKGNISIIIPKSAFKKNGKSDTFRYGEYTIKKNSVFGLKRSNKRMKDCDVIQTTTEQDKFQSCQVLRHAGNFDETTQERIRTKVDNIEQILIQAGDDFWRDYKEGKYIIDKVLDDKGKFVIVIHGKRFVFKDYMDLPDYSNGYSEYAYTKADGKYNLGKGIKDGYKSWAKNAGIATLYAFCIGWPFFAVSTTFAAVCLGSIALSALAVPFAQWIKAARFNRKNRVPKDKTKCNNKVSKKAILKELREECEKFASKNKEFTSDEKLRFIERMEKLEKQASQLAGGKTMSDFKIKNGKKSQVDASNYAEFKKYQAEMDKEESDLKKLFKKMKKGKITREEYNAKYDEHQKNLYNYVSKGIFVPKDKKFQVVLDAINTTKGFIITKYGELDDTATVKEKNIKENLKNKSLKISKKFKCSITKTKKEENELLINNLKIIAHGKSVDYDKVIIESNHNVEEIKGEVNTDQNETTTEKDKKNEVTKNDEVVEEKTKSVTKKDKNKKGSKNTQKVDSDDLEIEGLGFDIVKYVEEEKGRQSSTHKGAIQHKMVPVIKREQLNDASLKRMKKAISYLESGKKITKKQNAALTSYIKNNLNLFNETTKNKEFIKKNDSKNYIEKVDVLNKQYQEYVDNMIEREKDSGAEL